MRSFVWIIFIIQVGFLCSAKRNPHYLKQHKTASNHQSASIPLNDEIAAQIFKELETRELTPAQQIRAKENHVDAYLQHLNNPNAKFKLKTLVHKMGKVRKQQKFKSKLRGRRVRKMHKKI